MDSLGSHQYALVIRLLPDRSTGESILKHQSARTRGSSSVHSRSSEQEIVCWSEIFFFKIDHAVCGMFLNLLMKITSIQYAFFSQHLWHCRIDAYCSQIFSKFFSDAIS